MGSSALDRVYADFVKAPTARAGVLVCSVGAAVAYPLFLLLLYLFVDLLVWRGEVPSYSQLTPAQKREFATEWAGRADAERGQTPFNGCRRRLPPSIAPAHQMTSRHKPPFRAQARSRSSRAEC